MFKFFTRSMMVLVLTTLAMVAPLMITPSLAVEPSEVLKDPKLEARARLLSRDLRCLVCQNQSIDASDAPLAKDLRILLRERLVAGDSDEEVKTYLVNRFGEFVLLNPVMAPHTWALWFGPFVLLGIGAIVLFRKRKIKPTSVAETALSENEQKQLEELMDGKKG